MATRKEVEEASGIKALRENILSLALDPCDTRGSEWLSGKNRYAQRVWQKSVVQADTLGMPLEKAMTLEILPVHR